MEVKAEAMTLEGEKLRRSSRFKGFERGCASLVSGLGSIRKGSLLELLHEPEVSKSCRPMSKTQ